MCFSPAIPCFRRQAAATHCWDPSRGTTRCPACARRRTTPTSSAQATWRGTAAAVRRLRRPAPAADDLHALCQEAHITQTTIPQAGSASHRRIQKEVAGSCDASKLAWDVAVNCVNSLDGEEVKVTPSCCTPFLAAAESRRCFCSFLQELKVELSPISRKDAHLLHRRCGGLHPLPRCFSHRDEPEG
ncbi:uncharacterized protein LOC125553414 [Triticum urartu]|uniref:uncharacterized protein LOC125553414 n=1 Tax=Triticum urartu TaxID=4572 RepID=UPI0020435310|nr:uncharacterized protein LOC125553414 [Triticum urartu]